MENLHKRNPVAAGPFVAIADKAAVPEGSEARLTLIQLPSSKKAKECYVMIATVRE